MKVTKQFIRIDHGVTLVLHATREDSMRNDSNSRNFLPRLLIIRWTHFGDGDWTLIECTVRGPIVRKDGAVGLAEAKRDLYGWFSNGRLVNEAPDWVVALVKEHHP